MELPTPSPSAMPGRSLSPQKRVRLEPSEMMRRFEKALRLGGNTYTTQDVMDALKTGKMQCISNNNAWVVFQIVDDNRKRYMSVFLVISDDIDDVMIMQPQLIEIAKANGCEWIQTLGRRGWQGVLPNHGWKPTHTLFVLKVD